MKKIRVTTFRDKILAAVILTAVGAMAASAQTDITSSVTTLTGYWTSIEGLALIVLLFVLGRRMLRKV